ncbi:MAG: DUF488 domain-containing protein [Actinomycetota bacterium]|nr:DUF488 domain-containing protein [Actinomycetota bacterium]
MIDLYTSRWANRELARLPLTPVGISRGVPKFRLGYRYRRLMELAPSRETFAIEDREEFERAYRQGLEQIGIETIMRKLERIGREAGGLPLALLCFERVDEFCHRHVLRDFMTERGVEIRELEPGMLPPRGDEPQPALFDTSYSYREERG